MPTLGDIWKAVLIVAVIAAIVAAITALASFATSFEAAGTDAIDYLEEGYTAGGVGESPVTFLQDLLVIPIYSGTVDVWGLLAPRFLAVPLAFAAVMLARFLSRALR